MGELSERREESRAATTVHMKVDENPPFWRLGERRKRKTEGEEVGKKEGEDTGGEERDKVPDPPPAVTWCPLSLANHTLFLPIISSLLAHKAASMPALIRKQPVTCPLPGIRIWVTESGLAGVTIPPTIPSSVSTS